MKLLLNLSVGAGIERKENSLVKVIFEFDFLVAYFQFLQIMLSSLLLTHCLMIRDMFSEILNQDTLLMTFSELTVVCKYTQEGL